MSDQECESALQTVILTTTSSVDFHILCSQILFSVIFHPHSRATSRNHLAATIFPSAKSVINIFYATQRNQNKTDKQCPQFYREK